MMKNNFFLFSLVFLVLCQLAQAQSFTIFCNDVGEHSATQGFLDTLGGGGDRSINAEQLRKVVASESREKIWNLWWENCPIGTQCYHWIPWIFGQHPSILVRRLAQLWAIRIIEDRMRKDEFEELPSAISEYEKRENLRFTSDSITTINTNTAKYDIETLNRVSKKNKFKIWLARFTCLKEPKGCARALSQTLQWMRPLVVSGKNFNPMRFGKSTVFTRLEDWLWALQTPLVLEALHRMNQTFFKEITGAVPLQESNRLIEDLVRTVGELQPELESEAQKTIALRILTLYATRGSSFSQIFDYFSVESYPLIAEFQYFASSIQTLDALYFEKYKFSYALPKTIQSSCLYAKPYHFWMGAGIANALKDNGLSEKMALLGVHSSGLLYEFSNALPFRKKLSPLKNEEFASEIALNMAWNDFGAAWVLNPNSSLVFDQIYEKVREGITLSSNQQSRLEKFLLGERDLGTWMKATQSQSLLKDLSDWIEK